MMRLVGCLLALALAGPLGAQPKELVVHRGANRIAPENTLAAGRACIALGADYVEIDVRRSSDGVHYVLHDSTLDRTTNGSGPISSTPSSVVDTLDAGSWFSPAFAGEPVPRVDEYLDMAKGHIKVYFDVKDANLPALIALVEQHGMEEQCFFWFGNDAMAREFRELTSTIPLKINARTRAEVLEARLSYQAQIIECGLGDFDEELRTVAGQVGLKVMIYEPSTEANFRATLATEAEMVNLDDLKLYLALEREVDTESAHERAARTYGTPARVTQTGNVLMVE